MTKILLPLLFYVSGIINPVEVNSTETLNTIYYPIEIDSILYPEVYGPEAISVEYMCKPTGVETIIYSDAKAEILPEKKANVKNSKRKNQPVVKPSKRKSVKKVQQKKA